jgi:hypothetical protein
MGRVSWPAILALRVDSRFLGDEAAFGMTKLAVIQNGAGVCDLRGGATNLCLAASAYGVAGFFVGGAAAFGFAFVPELFAFGQG